MGNESATFLLRLPHSLKSDLASLALSEGMSLNSLLMAIIANAVGRSKDGALWQEIKNHGTTG